MNNILELITNWVFITSLIGLFACYMAWELIKFWKTSSNLKEIITQDNYFTLLEEKFQKVTSEYKKSCIYDIDGVKKSNTPSNIYFNVAAICRIKSINYKTLHSAGGTFVGMGLIGTFIGLAYGVGNVNQGSSQEILNSIDTLLGGMSTAFITSIAGMICSLVYSFVQKKVEKDLEKNLYSVTERIDNDYYVDDVDITNRRLLAIQKETFGYQKEFLQQFFTSLFSFTNEDGDRVLLANAIRDIYEESKEQSKALKAFKTDLAYILQEKFEQTLSAQITEKIVPLMNNLNESTLAVTKHIDSLSTNIKAPATDMVGSIVGELKESLNETVLEFKQGLSASATAQLEKLTETLGQASQSMTDLPVSMEAMSEVLRTSMTEVKASMEEMRKASAAAQEEVLLSIAKSFNSLVSNMGSSLKGVTDEINSQHVDLITLQDGSVSEQKKLVEEINATLETIKTMQEGLKSTLCEFTESQSQAVKYSAHMQSLTGDMRNAQLSMSRSQHDLNEGMKEFMQANKENSANIYDLISKSEEAAADYAEKFETINTGLTVIFSQIQNGLNEYSKTVQRSTQSFLNTYANSLADATSSLSSFAEQQNDLLEEFTTAVKESKNS